MDAIYDRTQADVNNRTQKGMFNLEDMQRLESNIETVANEVGVVFSKVDWTLRSEFPKHFDWIRIKNALNSIKLASAFYGTVPDRPFNTWQKWNQIEFMLYEIDRTFAASAEAIPRCGEFRCGERGFM